MYETIVKNPLYHVKFVVATLLRQYEFQNMLLVALHNKFDKCYAYDDTNFFADAKIKKHKRVYYLERGGVCAYLSPVIQRHFKNSYDYFSFVQEQFPTDKQQYTVDSIGMYLTLDFSSDC